VTPVPLRAAVLSALVLSFLPRPSHAAPSLAGGEGLLDVRSALTPGPGVLSISTGGLAYRLAEDQDPSFSGERDVVDGALLVSLGIGESIEAFGRLAAALYETPDARPISPRDGALGVKLALPRAGRWLRSGLLGRVNLPWGNRDRGFSTGGLDPALGALCTVRFPESSAFSSASFHFNIGYQWHGDDRGRAFEGSPLFYLEPVYPESDNDRVDVRAAVEFASAKTTLFAELVLDHLVAEDVSSRESPRFLTPGCRFSVSRNLSLLLASKISLATDDAGTVRLRPPEEVYPDWQLGFALAWTNRPSDADRDGDGTPDFRDRCPEELEDRDGWADHDGCPDPDNDGDGILDADDAAPDRAEDFDGFLDADGAPDPDNDGDGIPDAADACPDEREDRDGVEDDDGCPEEGE
jgi:hypothetical protein